MKAQILVSTYQGERYLREQLDSLLLQSEKDIRILVRDDGSKDRTPSILAEYAGRDSRLEFFTGENLGVVGSFFELLRRSSNEAEVLFFCDQDDFWFPSKVARAREQLKASGADFYFSRLQYVDGVLQRLGQSAEPKRLSFESALVENVATGCSVAFTQRLRKMALKGLPEKTEHCLMHDWWLYLLSTATSKVFWDPEPSLMYRQHGANVVGAHSDFWPIYATKWRRFWSRGARAARLTDQARLFETAYGPLLAPVQAKLLHSFIKSKESLISRLLWALRLPTPRQSRLDSLILRLLIVLGRY
jgi:glycosyltransferase involved in cell wall biosynthesis